MVNWIEKLASAEVSRFIQENTHLNEQELILKHTTLFGIPASLLARQLQGRRKAAEKLPQWYHTTGIVYPQLQALEQCSSQTTAQYKVNRIMQHLSGRQCAVDLTGGMGVDTYYLSTVFQQVDYVEPDEELLAISRHNHQVLGATNIRYHALSAEVFLQQKAGGFDLIFADPSRKDRHGNKVVSLQHCSPDITTLHDKIFAATSCFVLKASPLLDISAALHQLPFTAEVNVVAVQNEVKELLLIQKKDFTDQPTIRAVDLQKNLCEEFVFTQHEEQQATVHFSAPLTFLYEPNRAILKAGAFRLVGSRFGLLKLHPHTHLYTSAALVPHFPGRIFSVEPFSARHSLPARHANIIVRNYPATPTALARKFKLTEGGEDYLIACTSVQGGKHLLLGRRIK